MSAIMKIQQNVLRRPRLSVIEWVLYVTITLPLLADLVYGGSWNEWVGVH